MPTRSQPLRQRRTNVWRRVTIPAREFLRLRDNNECVEPCMLNPLGPGYSVPLGAPSSEDIPLPIVLCVTCRSKDISSKRLWRATIFVCNDCGTTLEQVGDQYKLTHVTDTGCSVWQKYAGKILFRREWSNIALGGYSDEELAIMWAPVVR